MSPVIKRYIIESIVRYYGSYKIFVLLIIIHELISIINLPDFFFVSRKFSTNFTYITYLRKVFFAHLSRHLLIINEHKIFKWLYVKLIVGVYYYIEFAFIIFVTSTQMCH